MSTTITGQLYVTSLPEVVYQKFIQRLEDMEFTGINVQVNSTLHTFTLNHDSDDIFQEADLEDELKSMEREGLIVKDSLVIDN